MALGTAGCWTRRVGTSLEFLDGSKLHAVIYQGYDKISEQRLEEYCEDWRVRAQWPLAATHHSPPRQIDNEAEERAADRMMGDPKP